MQKKLTITVDEEVYEGLHRNIGRGKISKYIEGLVRPNVVGHKTHLTMVLPTEPVLLLNV